MYLEEKAVPLPPFNSSTEQSGEGSSSEEGAAYIAYIILLAIMVVYVAVGTWMERKGCGFGHETGVVILLGISIGAILSLAGEKDEVSTVFNPKVLFDFGLPFILYAAGFNMRRRRFFDDINNITMFGVLSTVVCFIILSLTTMAVFQMGWIYKFSEKDDAGSW